MSQSIDVFKSYKAEVENQLGKKIKTVKSDRGGEYYGRYDGLGEQRRGPFAKFLEKCGIVPQYTMPGIQIYRDRLKGVLGLSQKGYIYKVLKRYGMQDCKPGDTPVAKGDKFSLNQCPKNGFETKEMEKTPYVSAVGSLMYAQVYTRPDLAYIVGILDRYLSNPGIDHWKAAKRVILYLQRTKDYMLIYRRSDQFEIIRYTDSDFAGCQDSLKSTSGYIHIQSRIMALNGCYWTVHNGIKRSFRRLYVLDGCLAVLGQRYSGHDFSLWVMERGQKEEDKIYNEVADRSKNGDEEANIGDSSQGAISVSPQKEILYQRLITGLVELSVVIWYSSFAVQKGGLGCLFE
ncbi:Retrovirus-related Pol polyprotein from transposon TNT 1-94-like protein [Drosera capensis]